MNRQIRPGLVVLATAVVLMACRGDSSATNAPASATTTPHPTEQVPLPTPTAATPRAPVPTATASATASAIPTSGPVSSQARWNSLGATDLSFSLSGGIAGFSRRLSLDVDARVHVEDLRNARARDVTLTATEASELNSLLQASGIASQRADQRTACADCFEYVLKLGGNNSYSITANSAGLDTGLRPVVEWSTALQQRELQ